MNIINKIVKNDVVYFEITLLRKVGIRTAFFQRKGGCSDLHYRSLNLGYLCGDNEENVMKNRIKAKLAGGFGSFDPVLVKQVHGSEVNIVDLSHAGQGWMYPEKQLAEADGLVTVSAGLPLAVKTADCMPVMIASLTGKGIAVVHGGWRGLLKGVVPEAVKKLSHLTKTDAGQMMAVLGPCISQKHFEITNELFDDFLSFDHEIIEFKGNKGYVSLPSIAEKQLLFLGFKEENIIKVNECTFSDQDAYFSYRRDQGKTGRMLSMIQIDE